MRRPLRRRWLAAAAGVLLALNAWAIDPEPVMEDPGRQALYDRLTHEVRCLVCQNQTVADSTAPLAADLRREIRTMVVEGKSEGEIKTFLLDRYGDFVLYKPQFKVTTALLWLAPALLLVIGAITLGMVLRRRASLPSDQDADENPPAAAGP
jgi:cytochrome c-type biogenesis protein CcmH